MKTFKQFLEKKELETNKKLVIYDFDGTLFHSPEPEEGHEIYLKATGKPWPFKGWWSKIESLLPPIVPQNPDPSWYLNEVVSAQKEDMSNPDATVILMTGRVIHLKDRILDILENQGIKFHDTYFAGQSGSVGSGTFEVKANNIRKIIHDDHTVLEIWEDRPEHCHAFSLLGKELKSEKPNLQTVIIHDVKRGTTEKF